MNKKNMHFIGSVFVFLTLTWTISCSGRPEKSPAQPVMAGEKISAVATAQIIRMAAPAENSEYKLGGEVKVILETLDNIEPPDSIVIAYDGKIVASLSASPWEYNVKSSDVQKTGRRSVKASAYYKGKPITVLTRFVIVKSDTSPKRYKYKVINSFPHDRDAYTQGLFYHNGLLYEGTGQETKSSLREVELQTGKIKRQLNIGSDLFGEGITLYGDRIYQVTWRSKVGFVYDMATFNQINRVYYQTEGWGLTTIDNRIVMSDGTNILYFMDPETFAVTSQLEVYDNEKKVDQLNELEYIYGEIWANIWMTDLIARIDPSSGKVTGYIDLKGLLKGPGSNVNAEELNGIAYDKSGDRIFVTGKNWPKLFEIKLTE
jgi:glutamine cyclotransferase